MPSMFCVSRSNWALLVGILFFLSAYSSAEKKVIFDSAVEDIQWAGPDYSTVLCRTAGSRLYRSLDSGRTWKEITSQFGSSGHSASPVKSIHVNPIEKNVVVVLGRFSSHLVSFDGGKSFRGIKRAGSVHSIAFHPTQTHQFLLSQWTPECKHETGKGEPCRHDLYFTGDLGLTFKRIARYVVQFAWGDPKHHQENRIYVSKFDTFRGPQPRSSGWSDKIHFGAYATASSSFRVLVPHGNKFLISNGYVFVAQLHDAEHQTVKLLVSTDGGNSFKATKLPDTLQERSYTILDTAQGAVMIHVNHGHAVGTDIAVGNVYISDATGERYSLSLARNVRAPGGECELESVASLEGIYIANFVENSRPHRDIDTHHADAGADDNEDHFGEDDDEEEEQEEESDLEIASETDLERRHHHRGKQEVNIRTVISFDKGGTWSYLRPPTIDSRGQRTDCAYNFRYSTNLTATSPEMCTLHLHGITYFHRYAPFYSVKSAVGLIMGTGNIGTSLRHEEDEMNTYLSRDGGLTWVEAHKGAYIYEFGDHGGLIVMANDMKKTKQVVFSWNEGQTWYDFDLGDIPLDVDNVVIEPNSSSVEFLLYGTRGSSGVLYHLDFSTLEQPDCKGVWAADSVSSDYETWSPSDGVTGSNCILGRQVIYTRRKPSSECFNGRDFERPVERQHCACTERDFECDYGFTRHVGSLQCVPQSTSLAQEGCTSSGIFLADAYRKIPGDTCQGGWIPSKVPVRCPHTSPLSSRARMVLGSIFGVVAFLGAITLLNTDSRFQNFLQHCGVDSLSNAKYTILAKAAHIVDAFDLDNPDDHQPPSTTRQDMGGTAVKITDDPLGFITSAQEDQHDDDDDDDAPPLLDFSPMTASTAMFGTTPHEGVALEAVPRLQPPPSSSTFYSRDVL